MAFNMSFEADGGEKSTRYWTTKPPNLPETIKSSGSGLLPGARSRKESEISLTTDQTSKSSRLGGNLPVSAKDWSTRTVANEDFIQAVSVAGTRKQRAQEARATIIGRICREQGLSKITNLRAPTPRDWKQLEPPSTQPPRSPQRMMGKQSPKQEPEFGEVQPPVCHDAFLNVDPFKPTPLRHMQSISNLKRAKNDAAKAVHADDKQVDDSRAQYKHTKDPIQHETRNEHQDMELIQGSQEISNGHTHKEVVQESHNNSNELQDEQVVQESHENGSEQQVDKVSQERHEISTKHEDGEVHGVSTEQQDEAAHENPETSKDSLLKAMSREAELSHYLTSIHTNDWSSESGVRRAAVELYNNDSARQALIEMHFSRRFSNLPEERTMDNGLKPLRLAAIHPRPQSQCSSMAGRKGKDRALPEDQGKQTATRDQVSKAQSKGYEVPQPSDVEHMMSTAKNRPMIETLQELILIMERVNPSGMTFLPSTASEDERIEHMNKMLEINIQRSVARGKQLDVGLQKQRQNTAKTVDTQAPADTQHVPEVLSVESNFNYGTPVPFVPWDVLGRRLEELDSLFDSEEADEAEVDGIVGEASVVEEPTTPALGPSNLETLKAAYKQPEETVERIAAQEAATPADEPSNLEILKAIYGPLEEQERQESLISDSSLNSSKKEFEREKALKFLLGEESR